MKSTVPKRSIVVANHKTSVSVEDAFWADLKKIAVRRNETLSQLLERIDAPKIGASNFSSAIRLFVLQDYRAQLVELRELKHSSDVSIAPK
jgi:predicted DNA-binding ribbon-helix-helix protein